MAQPIDVENAPGDTDGLVKSLTEAVTVQKATDDAQKPADQANAEGQQTQNTDPLAGTKFEGKSVTDVLDSYKNLESLYGRMANDLGDQRKLTDRLLDIKRHEDIQRNAPEPVMIESAELLDNPTAALDRFVSGKQAQSEQTIDERLDRFEGEMRQKAFEAKHPDFMQIGQDADFLSWAQESPTRSRVAQAASGGDWDAADALLSEYKLASTKQQPLPLQDGQNPALEEAKQVSLESAASASGDDSGGRLYRRADLMQLKMDKPHIYEDPQFQAEILKAYSEGRVK